MNDLPDNALVPMSWVREHFVPKATGEKRDMTTVELAKEFGHSPDWWQDRARKGVIHGAYQGGGRGRWYIPREQATVFLRELRESRRRKRVSRKPWKGPQEAQSGPGRAATVQARQMVGSGS